MSNQKGLFLPVFSKGALLEWDIEYIELVIWMCVYSKGVPNVPGVFTRSIFSVTFCPCFYFTSQEKFLYSHIL